MVREPKKQKGKKGRGKGRKETLLGQSLGFWIRPLNLSCLTVISCCFWLSELLRTKCRVCNCSFQKIFSIRLKERKSFSTNLPESWNWVGKKWQVFKLRLKYLCSQGSKSWITVYQYKVKHVSKSTPTKLPQVLRSVCWTRQREEARSANQFDCYRLWQKKNKEQQQRKVFSEKLGFGQERLEYPRTIITTIVTSI